MRISKKAWAKYIRKLAAVDQKAADMMTAYIEEHGMDDADELIRYAYALATKYGEAAAAAACEMYDATAAAQGANVPLAEPAPTATYGEVAKAVNGTKDISEKLVPQAVSRTVKMAGADTMLQNAERDGAQFAWVPMGDTCAFCLTLASRGWQYMSKKALKNGHAEHIHANCDCQYAVRFDSKSGVAGYDPEKYRKMYYEAEGSTPAEKIRAMRREIDAKLHNEVKTTGLAAGSKGSDYPHPHDPPKQIGTLKKNQSVMDILRDGERDIMDEPIENAIVVLTDGTIHRCYGTLNGVYPDEDFGDALRGASMTHNHPIDSDNEWSFSPEDQQLFDEYGLAVLRGSDSKFIYEMNRNPEDIDEANIPVFEATEYDVRHIKNIERARLFGYGYRRWERGHEPKRR